MEERKKMCVDMEFFLCKIIDVKKEEEENNNINENIFSSRDNNNNFDNNNNKNKEDKINLLENINKKYENKKKIIKKIINNNNNNNRNKNNNLPNISISMSPKSKTKYINKRNENLKIPQSIRNSKSTINISSKNEKKSLNKFIHFINLSDLFLLNPSIASEQKELENIIIRNLTEIRRLY